MSEASPAAILAKEQAKARRELLELAMLHQLRAIRLDEGMQMQYAPVPGRRFRSDFAWPEKKLLLECDGGTWDGGAHGRGSGIELDNEKLALTAILGYRTIKVTSSQVRSGVAICWVERAIKNG